MSDWIVAPPELLSAYSLMNSPGFDAPDYDPTIASGAHLRIFAGGGKSFPLTPFAVYRTRSWRSELSQILPRGTSDWSNTHVTFEGQPIEITPLDRPSADNQLVAIDFDDSGGSLKRVTLLDHRGRVMQVRDHAPWTFSAPALRRFRLEGEGRITFSSRVVNLDTLNAVDNDDLSALLGLPVGPGNGVRQTEWYVGHHTDENGMERVYSGATQSLNRMDLAAGDLASGSLSPDHDVERARWLLANGAAGGNAGDADLRSLLNWLIGDTTAPWDFAIKLGDNGLAKKRRQSVSARPVDMIQIGATDPALARYFGFGNVSRDDFDLWNDGNSWDTYAVLGLLAYDPWFYQTIGVNLTAVASRTDWTIPFGRKLIEALESSGYGYRDLVEERIRAVKSISTGEALYLDAQPFLTFACPTRAWRPPEASAPRIYDRHWHSPGLTTPSNRFRASFAFDAPPLTSLVAMSQAPIGFTEVTRNEIGNVAGLQRAVPMVLGSGTAPSDAAASSVTLEPVGLVADRLIAGDIGELTQSFRLSDMFGRFGESCSVPLGPPERPQPPQPVIRYWLEPAAPAAPQTLRVRAILPEPGDDPFPGDQEQRTGAMIIVPRLQDMESGSYAIKELRLSFDGTDHVLPLATPGTADASFALPVPPADGDISCELTAVYVATDDRESEPARTVISLATHVRPTPFKTGVGLFWTSRPGPSEHVTYKLAWDGPGLGLYRVYIADEHAFGLDDASRTRPRVATDVCDIVRHGTPTSRDRYQLLTEYPIRADDRGHCEYVGRLPRSLDTVQFIRVVPMDRNGNEAAFESCGIIPIAVPDNRRPPAPSHRVETFDDESGRGRIEVMTDGLNGHQLEREEQGLPPGERMLPWARLLVSAGAVSDPVYARPTTEERTKLALRDKDRFVFTASIEVGPLEPYVPYTLWAQTRLPPEWRAPPGVTLIDLTDGVAPVETSARENAARPWSTPSVPRFVMSTPRATLAMLDGATASLVFGGSAEITIHLPSAPVGHALMTAPYRLAIWALWPDSSEPLVNASGQWHPLDGNAPTLRVTPAFTPAHALQTPALRLAIVDPLGRLGPAMDIAPSQAN